MAGLNINREDTSETVTLKLVGNFNRDSAAEVLSRMPTTDDRTVVLDFSRVREFPDLAVPELSRHLGSRKVLLHGLARHQARMFGYFGLGDGRAEGVYYTPEEIRAV
ncbi:MAG: STAS domain-containing protein [Myxococcaceae bacterium]